MLASAAIVVGWLGGPTACALAGGGPENVVLVVNSTDAGSKTIANYFVQLRNVPPSNVVYLDPKTWGGSDSRVDVDTFRDKILRPIIQELKARSLAQQIDYIVYSSEFPWAINFTNDLPARLRGGQLVQNPEGSLSGMTYLMFSVLEKNAAEYISFDSNHYMRLRDKLQATTYEIPVSSKPESRGLIPPYPDTGPKPTLEPINDSSVGSHGFRCWYGWGDKGQLNEAGGDRYMLSTVLGVTYGRGNSVHEIIRYLQRSATADGTFPPGTMYFMDNADIRTQTHKPGFQLAVDLLRRLGVKAEILPGDIPKNRPDVQGLLSGSADFNWDAAKSTIRAGAICENFTSYGGIFDKTVSQTPLPVFLKNGAAGASGTVTEPFAFQNKFSHPMVQVHYARGCTLAEAFYQAIYAPYQLIIVGDPLCRPWANIPQVKVDGVAAGDTLKDTVTLHCTATLPRQGQVDRFTLFVDGLGVDDTNEDGTLELDTTKYSDGYHELRIVGFEKSAIESQGRMIIPVQFANYGKNIQFEASPEQRVRSGGTIKLFAKSAGAVGVAFYQNNRVVAKFAGESGEASLDTNVLGEGPVSLQAIGWGSTNAGEISKHVMSAPVNLTIEGPSIREEALAPAVGGARRAKFEQ